MGGIDMSWYQFAREVVLGKSQADAYHSSYIITRTEISIGECF